MKKIALALACIVTSIACFAQCDKKIILTSSKTEYLNASMVVQRTEDEKSYIEISQKDLTIAPGNEDHKMTGTVKSTICNWTIPYKEGKSVIKGTINDQSGDIKNITLTIEGKEGKLTLLAEVEEMPDMKIRVPVDTFEEKK